MSRKGQGRITWEGLSKCDNYHPNLINWINGYHPCCTRSAGTVMVRTRAAGTVAVLTCTADTVTIHTREEVNTTGIPLA